MRGSRGSPKSLENERFSLVLFAQAHPLRHRRVHPFGESLLLFHEVGKLRSVAAEIDLQRFAALGELGFTFRDHAFELLKPLLLSLERALLLFRGFERAPLGDRIVGALRNGRGALLHRPLRGLALLSIAFLDFSRLAI